MKNKGFTILELLAVIVVLGLLMMAGMYTVNNLNSQSKDKYYETMENTLKIAGNDYFNDNRADRPVDDYNFVSMDTLIDHEYMDELKEYQTNNKCDNHTGVFIYNSGATNQYEVCLICGEYRSNGAYCSGNIPGQIEISGTTNTGAYYNPILSYSGTPWANVESVNITYRLMGDEIIDRYAIYNTLNNEKYAECLDINEDNSCSNVYNGTGSYYVVAYNGTEKVGNRKFFNVKIDNVPPTFELKDETLEFYLDDNSVLYEYANEIININDDNGYNSVIYSFIELDTDKPRVNIENEDLLSKDLKITESLPSGRYQLTVTVSDYAGNKATKSLVFIIYYDVSLGYYDNSNNYHNLNRIKVYTNGKYTNLPSKINISGTDKNVEWYDNTSYAPVEDKYLESRKVTKNGYHILYGHEVRQKVSLSLKCNNKGNFTYNGEEQELVTGGTGYTLINNKQTNAGTYTIVAKLDKDYMWSNGTRTNRIVTCTIKPYKVSFTPKNATCKTLTFNGNYRVLVNGTSYKDVNGAKDAPANPIQVTETLNGKTETSYTINNLYRKNAGTQKVTFALANDNYVWSNGTSAPKESECKISKLGVTIEWGTKVSFVYDGEEHAPSAKKTTGDYYEITYTRTKEINAGSYTSTATCKKAIARDVEVLCSNFKFSSTKKDYTITKAEVTIPTNKYCVTAPTYDGTEKTLTKAAPAHVTFSNTKHIDAGTYKITASLESTKNYKWTDGKTKAKTFECIINQKSIKASWSGNTSFTYDGSAHGPTASISGTGIKGETMTIKTTNTSKKNAGSYTASAECVKVVGGREKCSNYKFSSGTKDFSIGKKSVAVTWSGSTSFTYDGKEHGPTASISGTGITGESMTITNTKATAAGSHTSTASCSSVSGGQANCSNYSLTNNTKDFKINSPTPSDATSCNKYWYSISFTCVRIYDGTVEGPKTKTGTGYSSESAAAQGCSDAKSNLCGSGYTIGYTGSCYTYKQWTIRYKNSSGQNASGGPYSTRDYAKSMCSGKTSCYIACG